MNLKGKLAQLKVGKEHIGTAWLIDKDHALTALHCVRSKDKKIRGPITLRFFGIENPIPVSVLDFASELDIAVLKVDVSEEDLSSRVILLSRSACEPDSSCRMRGHPEQSQASSPDGITVIGTVHDTAHHYNYDELVHPVILIRNINVSRDPEGRTGLEGISGGVLVRDSADESAPALAVVLGEQGNGNYLYAMDCSAIANRFQVVQNALIGSPDVSLSDTRILIELQDSKMLRWAAPFTLGQVGELWSSNAVPFKFTLHCAANLRNLGQASKALIRFVAYSELKEIYVIDQEDWTASIHDISKCVRPPTRNANIKIVPSPAHNASNIPPSRWHYMSIENFSEILHRTLNKALLTRLDGELYSCLSRGKDTDIGCEIESSLRQKMWNEWEAWKPVLEGNAALLRRFLARVFSMDAAGDDSDEILMTIGYCQAVHQQLFRATLFALALSAAGVDTMPTLHNFGNFTIKEKTAHACGLEKNGIRRIRIDRVIDTIDWKTDVVILPYLQDGLMELFAKSVRLTKVDGSATRGLQRILPVAVTADTLFLEALERGVSHVADYYEKRVKEITASRDIMRVYSRTEELDA